MSAQPTTSPWYSDEDVETAARADAVASLSAFGVEATWESLSEEIRAATCAGFRHGLDALAPRVDALVRAGQVEALREAADLTIGGFGREVRNFLLGHADAIGRGDS